jgi:hypothetical protein
MHNAAPNTLSRPVVSLAHISDPSGCCAAIDLFIEKPDLAVLAAELGMPVVLYDEAGRASGRGRDERRRQRNIGDLADAMGPPSGDLRQA